MIKCKAKKPILTRDDTKEIKIDIIVLTIPRFRVYEINDERIKN
jgi:hypothetical protein